MAKNKKTAMAQKKQKKMMVARVPRRPREGNSAVAAYAKLLLDPCNAELTPSPYGQDAGAQVVRRHEVYNNFNDAQVFFWHPVLGLFRTVANTGTPGTVFPVDAGQMYTNYSNRAIAGCAEVMFTGAESTRAGTVQCGVIQGSLLWRHLATGNGGGGIAFDVANVAGYIPNVERTPVDRCGVNWFPGAGDCDWIPPINNAAANSPLVEKVFAATHFCVVFVAGGGTNSFRLSMTGVVEQVIIDTGATTAGYPGAVWTITPKITGTVDYEGVVKKLSQVDSSWYLNTFKKVAKFGLGLVNSTLKYGLPGALSYLTSSVGIDSVAVGGRNQQVVRSGR